MFDKLKTLPLAIRVILSLALGFIWMIIAPNLNLDSHFTWIVSTLILAGIYSLFFPFTTPRKN